MSNSVDMNGSDVYTFTGPFFSPSVKGVEIETASLGGVFVADLLPVGASERGGEFASVPDRRSGDDHHRGGDRQPGHKPFKNLD